MAHWTARGIAYELSKNARRSGNNWITKCPAHADIGPSLSLMDKGEGRVIFNCLAGCDFRNVSRALAELGIVLPGAPSRFAATAIEPPAPTKRQAAPRRSQTWDYAPQAANKNAPDLQKIFGERAPFITQSWDWHSPDGALLFKTIRLDEPPGGQNVVPVTPCICRETGVMEWRMQGPTGNRPLYNLAELKDQTHVLVLEGEKTTEAAKVIFSAQPNTWATTTLGGAKSPHLVDWSPVAGRIVVISHDYDASGIAFAAAVSENCRNAGATAIFLATPPQSLIIQGGAPVPRTGDAPKGYDLYDAKEEGWTAPLLATFLTPWHGPEIVTWPKIPLNAEIRANS